MSAKAYEAITARIVGLLEQGTVPWQRTWKTATGFPRNLVSKKAYRGINVFMLLTMGYESPYWLTFRQANALGGTVKKGEKACPVVFWKRLRVEDKETEEKSVIPLLRFYHVFNLSQCEGINMAGVMANGELSGDCAKPEEIVANMPQRPPIKNGFTQAFYSPHEDYIGMPLRERFNGSEAYYATLFHELVHSTGHEKRLNRSTLNEKGGYGSDPYCKEELIAEMGAAFLCGHAGIVERTIDKSSAYIQGWLTRLKGDATLVVQAAAQAQKAADFILDVTYEENMEVGDGH